MFKTILAATDGSNHAERAVTIAAEIASKFDAKLITLHVTMHGSVPPGFARMVEVEHMSERARPQIPEFRNMSAGLTESLRNVNDGIDEHRYYEIVGNAILSESKKIAKKHGAKNAEAVIVAGDFAETIVDYASKNNVDLIVMGTRGLGELKGLLMGSVSNKVIQTSKPPCLTGK